MPYQTGDRCPMGLVIARHLACGDVIISPRQSHLQISCEAGCEPIDIAMHDLLLLVGKEVSNCDDDRSTARTG